MSRKALVINVHYAPQSFGGATIVAEQLVEHLQRESGWQCLVITSHVDPAIPAYSLRRYRAGDSDVMSINLPLHSQHREQYTNPHVDAIVEEILRRYRPDLVHCHAVQALGCGYFSAIKQARIPLVVTVHDSWWFCERQFMIDGSGRFCFQMAVDRDRCRYCVDVPSLYDERRDFLRHRLAMADLVLTPSSYQRDLYVANGVPPERCRVNENGIVRPARARRRSKRKNVHFGFIGGPGAIKGADVIVEAFNALPAARNYRLLVVNAAQNVGSSWQNRNDWRIPGDMTFYPAYTQATIDDFFDDIDVLLFPSQWRESFGLTVREALARDVWVIATGEGGLAEAIEPGRNGEAIPLGPDPQPLASAIGNCLAEPERWQHYHNPVKARIRFFKEQARELHDYFLDVMDRAQ